MVDVLSKRVLLGRSVLLGSSVWAYFLEELSPLSFFLIRFTLISIDVSSVAGSITGFLFFFLLVTFVVTGVTGAGLSISGAASRAARVHSRATRPGSRVFSRLGIFSFVETF